MDIKNEDNWHQVVDRRQQKILSTGIASAILRTDDNHLSDKFRLSLSASFGSEFIHIKIDGEELRTRVRINRAKIVLEWINCRVEPLKPDPDNEFQSRETIQRSGVNSRNRSLGRSHANLVLDPSPASLLKTEMGYGYESEEERSSSRIIEIVHPNQKWWNASIDTLITEADSKKWLNGQIIYDVTRWRLIKIEEGSHYGALAKIFVQEPSIDFSEDEYIKTADSIFGKIFRKHFSRSSERRRIYFRLLLRHLVFKQFQTEDEPSAILFWTNIFAAPQEVTGEWSSNIYTPPPAPIEISGEHIRLFLETPEGFEGWVLRNAGVDDSILADAGLQGLSDEERWKSTFRPQSSPQRLCATLDLIMSTPGITSKDVMQQHTRNALLDLRHLKLIELGDDDAIKPKIAKQYSEHAEELIKHGASQTRSVSIAVEILRTNPANDFEFGHKFADAFGIETWNSEESFRRGGSNMKTWAEWLIPYHRNPADPEYVALRKGKATRGVKKGRIPKLSKSVTFEIASELNAGKSIRMIAQERNVAVTTIRNYLKKYKIR